MRNARNAVFMYLAQLTDTAPVQLSIGTTFNGVVDHNYVVLHNAPARVVSEVVDGFRGVSLSPAGLLIPLFPETEENA